MGQVSAESNVLGGAGYLLINIIYVQMDLVQELVIVIHVQGRVGSRQLYSGFYG